MGLRSFVGAHWRVILLVILVGAALVALFVPGGLLPQDEFAGGGNESADAGGTPTNLAYGLGLDGGTRISAPVVGTTAEGLEIEPDRASDVEATLQEELGVDSTNVSVQFHQDSGFHTAELFTDDVSHEEFAAALRAADVEVEAGDVRDGVTQSTRDSIIRTIETKINEAGLSGGRVSQSSAPGGQYYIVTEVPERTPAELQTLLSDRGIVEVRAHYPDGEGGQTNETVLEQGDFASVDPAAYNDQNGHHVPVSISEEVAPEFQAAMNEYGFTGPGVGQCAFGEPGTEGQNYCLLTIVNGEVVDAHSMGSDLAGPMRSGEWVEDPQFVMLAPSQTEAQTLSVNLRAGSLRAPLDFENDRTFSVEPALADQFKLFSLVTGVLAVLTVSGVVYLRYADRRVAGPMVVTALAEVVILLGFAAAIRMPLDLSHVAGFIAVVGTGVNDLIIIADEVMEEGDVNSRRVFASRFRKAFWVIGAAAATTVIAMAPLAVLSLGDLRGFAIITILGVLIGVFVTRPAYGDILRYLLTGE